MSKLQALINAVKQREFYVPRGYTSIGGMWTVDTWVRNGVTVRVEDEGYTTRVQAPGLYVVNDWFQVGSESDVEKLLNDIEKTVDQNQ